MNPMVHYHYAQTLIDGYREGHEIPKEVRSRAAASLEKTLASAPSHVDAARLFGFLCLFDDAMLERGTTVVNKTLESHRGNSWLLLILGQLYSHQGKYAEARTIFENLLGRKLDAELVAQVRRHLDYVLSRLGSR